MQSPQPTQNFCVYSEFLSFFVLYSRILADFLSHLGKWVILIKFEAENEFFCTWKVEKSQSTTQKYRSWLIFYSVFLRNKLAVEVYDSRPRKWETFRISEFSKILIPNVQNERGLPKAIWKMLNNCNNGTLRLLERIVNERAWFFLLIW